MSERPVTPAVTSLMKSMAANFHMETGQTETDCRLEMRWRIVVTILSELKF